MYNKCFLISNISYLYEILQIDNLNENRPFIHLNLFRPKSLVTFPICLKINKTKNNKI